ncbi:MAG: hypothetical protein A2X94_07490 [Bdellovibrionales bacterium GWB1_55_8]|nr:MAG: hypothetical protein A2X94_07490 [Bdellovibrionales bacterium GWB1_55_8]
MSDTEPQHENSRESFEDKLRTALALDLPYSERLLHPEGRAAAVLILFGWNRSSPQSGPSILLTRRTELVETHKGQIAFPGGVVDPEDADSVAAALRETEEEVGISPASVRVLGELPKLWTVTGFWITPIVGILHPSIGDTTIRISPAEIAEVFWAPLVQLQASDTYREEQFVIGRSSYPIHVYQLQGHRVWGATGAMLKNLLDRIERLR